MKALVQFTTLSLAIALVGVSLNDTARAQPNNAKAKPNALHLVQRTAGSLRIVRQPLPPGKPPGGRYRGGGSRSVEIVESCPEASPDLTALVPFVETPRTGAETLPPIVDVWGYTATEHPTFWFYMPYSAQQNVPVVFSVENESGELVNEQKVALSTKPGLIRVQLPTTKPGLQPEKRYRWFLEMQCRSRSGNPAGTDMPSVEGVIIRQPMEPAIASQIAAASGSAKAALYANNGFWFDALNTLAELRRKAPQDSSLAADWRSLLESMNLSTTASTRLVKPFDSNELIKQPFAQ
jgi:Domain of Unknown Function (DUF928)